MTLQVWLLAGLTLTGGAAMALLAQKPSSPALIAEFRTPLIGRTPNQRHNAELSARRLSGAVIAPGQVFSFNGRVGSWSRDQGYRRAPVSYNGTLIDAWGGGVCQTSTTLYNAGLLAGLEVIERHPHRFAPGYCPPGRDAAVAFSGVDLRLRNPYPTPLFIKAETRGSDLVVRLSGVTVPKVRPVIKTHVKRRAEPEELRLNRGREAPRVRNLGKSGFEVVTYRVTGDRWEPISEDSYPVMNRIVEE